MSEVSVNGLNLEKHVFQIHGPDASGQVVLRKHLRRGLGAAVLRPAAGLPSGDGSLFQGALLES